MIPSVIKCAHGCNQCRDRDAIINRKLTGIEYLKCNKVETWDYVIKCKDLRHVQRQFIRNLAKELLKINKRKVDEEIILDVMEDIVAHFDNGNEDKCATS